MSRYLVWWHGYIYVNDVLVGTVVSRRCGGYWGGLRAKRRALLRRGVAASAIVMRGDVLPSSVIKEDEMP